MEREPGAAVLERPFDLERRLWDDTETWGAEILDGQMRTVFDYTPRDGELYAQDGSPMGPVFKDALHDAEQQAARDPRLRFGVRRSHHENDELNEMYAMARGEGPNAMVVVSDSPAELANFSQDVAGYSLKRRQTMLRVIIRTEEGNLRMYSQSLDRSNRKALEAIYASLGFQAQPGELLGQRMHLDVDAVEREFLVDKLTGVYDHSMKQQYPDQDWFAGRTPAERVNTYDFVRKQRDLVGMFVQAKLQNSEVAEGMRYQVAATLTRRFKAKVDGTIMNPRALSPELVSPALIREMHTAGIEAQMLGTTFSGCGLTIEQADQAVQEQLRAAGYGTDSQVCVEIKNGQLVKCPECKLQVKAIVPDKESIFCSNPNCNLAHPKVVQDHRRSKATSN